VLSESAARTLFGSTDPIGQHVQLATAYMRNEATAQVVGVVSDVRYDGITDPAGPVVYAPALQFAPRRMYVLVRTAGDPAVYAAAMRNAAREVASDVPVLRLLTLNEHLSGVLARTRLMALLLGSFAAFALALSVIGVFGIIAFSVEQRRSEIGLRLALGAEPSGVANLVAGTGFAWFALGIGIGLPCAIAASRALRGLLYDIPATDGITYAAVIGTLLVTGALGAWIPARRAANVDPRETLRAG
jgi:putative ABC transport system permease protein